MKTPRVKDFDPDAKAPILKSSMENMPTIEKSLQKDQNASLLANQQTIKVANQQNSLLPNQQASKVNIPRQSRGL